MAEFPTGFVEPYQISPTDVFAKHNLVFQQLENQGFVVVAGLDREHVPDLTEIAGQAGTREYCPKDLAQRWTDEAAAEKQLAKDGGRGVFRLESRDDGSTIGYGWTGRSGAEEKEILKECDNTFAVRLHEKSRGRGLATPFTQAIVFGSMALFGAKRIGLETWASNTAAVNAYLRAGALPIKAVSAKRPTLDKYKPVNREWKHVVDDVRMYMEFPDSF